MSTTMTNHPTEDALVECALNEGDAMLLAHIEQCSRCSDYVEEIRTMSREIASLDDEPVPERLGASILAIARGKRPQNYVWTFLQTWYKRPFLIGIVTVGVILLLYVLLVLHF